MRCSPLRPRSRTTGRVWVRHRRTLPGGLLGEARLTAHGARSQRLDNDPLGSKEMRLISSCLAASCIGVGCGEVGRPKQLLDQALGED